MTIILTGAARNKAVHAISGAVASNAQSITVTDAQTNASGYSRSMYINHTTSGVKTSSGEANVLGVDLTIGGNLAGYGYGISIYTAISGTRTIGMIAALSIYCDKKPSGGSIATYHAMDIGMDATNAAGDHGFMRLYAAAGTVEYVMRLRGSGTYFLKFEATDSLGCSSSTAAGNVSYKVKCIVNTTTAYLHLYDA